MKLVHLVGFIIKKFVTMHGHMNVKKVLTHYALPGRGMTCDNTVRSGIRILNGGGNYGDAWRIS